MKKKLFTKVSFDILTAPRTVCIPLRLLLPRLPSWGIREVDKSVEIVLLLRNGGRCCTRSPRKENLLVLNTSQRFRFDIFTRSELSLKGMKLRQRMNLLGK